MTTLFTGILPYIFYEHHGKFSFDGEQSWLKPAHACNETPDKDCTDFNGWESQARVSLSIKG